MALAVGSLQATTSKAPANEDSDPLFSFDIGRAFDAPFLTATGGSQYAAKPRPVDQPINTLKCDNRSAVIVPTLVRVAHGSVDKNGKKRGRADHDICEPLPTQSTSNEFALVEPSFLVTTGYGERVGQAPRIHSLTDPLGTMVACGAKHALVAVSLIRTDMHKSNATCAFDVNEPVNSITTGGGFGLVQASLQANDNQRAAFITNNNTNRLATSVADPVPAMTTGNQQIVTEVGMVAADQTAAFMAQNNAGKIGHAMTEPVSTMTTSVSHQSVVEAGLRHIDAVHLGQENFSDPGRSVEEPLSTVTLSPHQSIIKTGMIEQPAEIVAAHMAQQNEGNVGHSVTEPMSTMTTKVCHQNLVTSHMLTLRQNGFGQSMEEPMSAFTAAGNHHGEVRACFVKYYGEGGQWQDMGDPLDTLTTKARFAVIKVPVAELGLTEEQRFEAWWIARFLETYGTKEQGNPLTAHLGGPRPSAVGRPGAVLWTIQMRMLVPKEAAAASSFPEGYELEKTAEGKPVSKTNQMQLIGNAVCPLVASELIRANVKPRLSLASEPTRLAA
jgi:DNA (cytosine-5)-methyltransferase 1